VEALIVGAAAPKVPIKLLLTHMPNMVIAVKWKNGRKLYTSRLRMFPLDAELNKIKYGDYDEGSSSSGKKAYFESTDCTRNGSEAIKARHQRHKNFMRLNASHERVPQVQISDQSIDEIDEEEECGSIPSEDKPEKKIQNEFYHRINQASQNPHGMLDDPY
jgi:hypothetical protein